MRVLFPIGNLYPSQAGGPANSVYWLARALKSNGIAVTLVTTDLGINAQIELGKWLGTDYGQVMYCKTRFYRLPLCMIATSLRQARAADIVHLSSLFHTPALVCALGALFFGKKIMWSVRGELDPEALKFNRLAKQCYLAFIKKIFASRACFHATSTGEARLIRQVMGVQVQTVQFPNYMEIPSPATRQPANYLLYIGRIHPIKALDRLLEGCARSEQFIRSDFRLIIAGGDDDGHARQLKSLAKQLGISDKVVFYGYVEGATKQQLLADAHYSFLVSHSENFGNLVIESLAQGTPVVASTGTPWQVLPKRRAGHWIDNSPTTIAAMLDHIIREDDQYPAFRQNARAFAEEEMNIEHHIGSIIQAYQTVLKTKNTLT